MKKPTLGEIRAANERGGFHFFDRKTLRFFGETMRNYRVGKVIDGKVSVIRRGGKAGSATFLFDPDTGECRKP